jgi:hypothetical protein
VSTISTASVSRPRPLAATNRESFNLLTATTRLTRSSLQSVRNQVGCSSVRTWSSRHAPDGAGYSIGRHLLGSTPRTVVSGAAILRMRW